MITTTTDRAAALEFLASQQSNPATSCAYLGTLADSLESDLQDLDQPWLETLRVSIDADGAITGASLVEWDEEVGMAWVHGPWATAPTWDRDAGELLEAAIAQANVDRFEVYGEVANTRLAELATARGWQPSKTNYVYRIEREQLPAADASMRPATAADLAMLKPLHDTCFPRTYATAEQLVAGERYTTFVAVENGALLGYVAGHLDAGEAYLDFVAVPPEARRRGMASRLIGTLAQHLPSTWLTLTVDEGAPDALALYAKQGWREQSATRAYRWERTPS